MTAKEIRRMWRVVVPADALTASEQEERIALVALRQLVDRGIVGDGTRREDRVARRTRELLDEWGLR